MPVFGKLIFLNFPTLSLAIYYRLNFGFRFLVVEHDWAPQLYYQVDFEEVGHFLALLHYPDHQVPVFRTGSSIMSLGLILTMTTFLNGQKANDWQ